MSAAPNPLMNVSAVPLAGGDAGVQQTIRAMRRLIEQGKKDPLIHELAAQILQRAGVAAFDWRGEVQAIGEAVGRNVRFTRDVTGKETLHAARDIVRLRIGDCDDFTILICSLLETIGCRTRIVTVSNHPEDPGQFSHVYPEALVQGEWIPVDFARRSPSFGKGPENYFRKRVWQGADDYEDVAGLSGGSTMRRQLSGALQLPRAYRADSIPQFRQRHRAAPVIGVGHYGKPGMKGLGDFSDTADSIAQLITAGTSGAASIIRSTIPGLSPFGLPGSAGSVYNPATGQYYNPATGAVVSASGSIAGIPSSYLLLGGLGVLALLLVKGRN